MHKKLRYIKNKNVNFYKKILYISKISRIFLIVFSKKRKVCSKLSKVLFFINGRFCFGKKKNNFNFSEGKKLLRNKEYFLFKDR